MKSQGGRWGAAAYGWVILIVLFMAQFAMSMGAYAWGPLAPLLRETLDISRSQIGQITSALYFTAALTGLPSGIMVDRWGARKLLLICIAIMMVSFLFLSVINRFIAIVILAAIAGLGYGILNQVSTKGIMLWFTAKDRATAMGIKQTGVPIGAAVASVLLPVVAMAHGLGVGFLAIALFMFPVLVGAAVFYAEKPAKPISEGAGQERRKAKPDLRGALLKPEMLTIMIVLPFMCFNQLSLSTFLVLYLTEAVKVSIGLAGSCLAVAMVTGAIGRVGWGLISDRFFAGNRQKPLILLLFISFFCAVCLSFLPQQSSPYLCFVLAACLGVTFLGWNGLVITHIAELAGTRIAASVVGVSSTVGFAGVILGPLIFGFLVDRFSYFTGWMLLAAISMLNAVALMIVGARMRRQKGER